MKSGIPTKEECFYILEMLESSLIDFSYTQPWADQIFESVGVPPSWICDVATKKYNGDQKKAFREFVFGEPFERSPENIEKFHVGCLWLRYERRELSWATYLQLTGSYLDAASGDWDCEIPYHYLNRLEDEYFTPESEKETKRLYLEDHDVRPWAMLAAEKFEPLKKIRRTNKTSEATA